MALSGEPTRQPLRSLGKELAQVEHSGPRAIVIDLRDVTFIDSSGFKEFLEAKSRAQSNGHRLPAHEWSQPASAAARRSSCFLCWTSTLAACQVDQ
jgi:hypothetical protein